MVSRISPTKKISEGAAAVASVGWEMLKVLNWGMILKLAPEDLWDGAKTLSSKASGVG